MTNSNDLMLAILSMDAYDQGYGAGISNMPGQIGSANLLNVALPAGSFDAGFYAAAYSYNVVTGGYGDAIRNPQ
ncbi:hypothetical protein [Rhodoblastus sp.]|uniref:hypothetical protein n=1 Tax=Rhodoblastus sp. TaxID=1962975 RepID=UPI003F94A5B5